MAMETGRRDFWQAHVKAWRESGLTQRAYCRRHELPETQLSQWKHRLWKAQRRPGAKTRLVPVRVIDQSAPRTGRAHRHGPQGGECGGDLAVVFSNGLRLEIGTGFDTAALRRVLEVLDDVG